MHTPIQFINLELGYGEKTCFTHFNTTIYPGEKIAIIGDNGSGKSCLLKYIADINQKDLNISYIPQIIEDFSTLSGGQRFNKALSAVLANHPNLLLLDEPTNHLDEDNRHSLTRLLRKLSVTQIIVSHDVELLDNHIDSLWHIVNGYIRIFRGKYSDYCTMLAQEKEQLLEDVSRLNRDKQNQHAALMKEQQRSKKKKIYGEKKYEGDKIALRSAQGSGQRTTAKNNAYLNQKKSDITERLNQLWQPEEIHYLFDLVPAVEKKAIVTINQGVCGYKNSNIKNIFKYINFDLSSGERVALSGPNGSGKSTLIKAIMNDLSIYRDGEWFLPDLKDIAYLDQHYSNLPEDKTILEFCGCLKPSFSHAECRHFLNQFLFCKNEEVNRSISVLSGGEKARLSLVAIALQRPRLLILDEITNNIDLTTREHITQVLKSYSGAMLIISHEENFLKAIDIDEYYDVRAWY